MRIVCTTLMTALLLGGCSASRLRIPYRPGEPPDGGRIFSAGTGDEIEITIEDSVWLNRYGVDWKRAESASTDTPPIAGAVELNPVAALAAALRTVVPTAAVKTDTSTPKTLTWGIDGCTANVNALATYLRRTPSQLPLAAYLTDSTARRIAADLTKDDLPRRVQKAVTDHALGAGATANGSGAEGWLAGSTDGAPDRFESNGRPPRAAPRNAPSPAMLESFRGQAAVYARHLDALAARFPGDPASFEPEGQLGTLLDAARACRPTGPGPAVGGVDIAALAGVETALFMDDLLILQRRSAELVHGMNLLARWTVSPGPGRIVLGPFHAPGMVTATLKRVDRFRAYTLGTVVQGPPPAGPREEDCPKGKQGAECPKGPEAGVEPGRPPARIESAGDAAEPEFRIEILQRYRFRFGVGIGYSSLESIAYETKDDSTDAGKGVFLREVGRTPNQVVPVATLSYVLFPWSGKLIASQQDQVTLLRQGRWREYFERAGLAIQAGMSVSDLTDQVFAALVTEPIAGVELGVGGHFSRVDSARFPADTFVPIASGSPLRKERRTQWWALTVSVDGTVIGRTFASLLGLK